MAPLPRTHGSPQRARGGIGHGSSGGSSGSSSSSCRHGGGGGGGVGRCTLASVAQWGWKAGCLGLLGLTLCLWAESIWVATGPDGERISLRSAIGNSLRLTLKGSASGAPSLRRGTPDRLLRIVGTHHKTGTMLLSMLLREGYRVHMERTGRSNGLMMGYFGNAEAPDAPFSFYYCDHLYADTWNKTEPGEHMPKLVDRHQFFGDSYDFVHLVRDPLELVISAYLYHYSTPPDWQEPWLYEPHPLSNYAFILEGSSCKPGDKKEMSWYDLLHCLNEEEGLLAEATFQTHFGALPSMTAVAKTLHGKAGTRTLQLGLEEFQEGDFDDAVRRMYAFFGFPDDEVAAIVRGCSQYDLKRQSKEEKAWNQHVTTGKFDKWRLRRFLAEKFTDPKFLEARALLGYPKKPSEAP